MTAVTVHHGDSREVLKSIPDASVDSVVTDPPYALVSIVKRFGADGAAAAQSGGATGVYARASAGFMGQRWDTGETAFDPAFWAEVLRVLKPGGWLVGFGGTRSHHRLACGSSVECDVAAAVGSADDIRAEPLAVVDVVELDVLELADTRGFQEVGIDAAGALVVEVRLRDPCTVQFGLEHGAQHC